MQQPIVYQHPEIFRRKQSMIKRSLIISAVNLCCNLPSHALRTIWTLDSTEQLIPQRNFSNQILIHAREKHWEDFLQTSI
jgi:hypothetical protein